MPLNASLIKSGFVRPDPLEPGNYLARVVQVVDLGLQYQSPFKGQEKPPAYQISVTYELVTEFLKDEDGNDIMDKPRWVSEIFPIYGLDVDRAKSNQRLRAIDPNLETGGDFTKLLGRPCTITVVNNQKGDVVYTNVGNVTPPMKGAEIPELVNSPVFFDLEDPDMDVFEKLPNWIQDKIKSNLEFDGSVLAQSLGSQSEGPTQSVEVVEDDSNQNPY